MGLAEDGVVDFLTDSVQDGDVVVGVLGATVTLDGLVALGTHVVELLQEVGVDHVVGIEDDDIVKMLPLASCPLLLEMVDGKLHGLGLAALLKDRLQQGDAHLAQLLVGLGLHVVGDDGDVEVLIGIVLAEEGVYGVDDDTVFVVGRVEHQELVVVASAHAGQLAGEVGRQGRLGFLPHQRHQCEEQDIAGGKSQKEPEENLQDVQGLPEYDQHIGL